MLETKETLGVFYETVHVALLASDMLYSKNNYNTSYIDRFENGVSVSPTLAARPTDVYDDQARSIEVAMPGADRVRLSNLNVNPSPLQNSGPGSGPRLLCVDYTHSSARNPATPINNVMFLEV